MDVLQCISGCCSQSAASLGRVLLPGVPKVTAAPATADRRPGHLRQSEIWPATESTSELEPPQGTAAPASNGQPATESKSELEPTRGRDSGDGMGGASPICPAQEQQIRSGRVTLERLQGEWQSGNGSQVRVTGTSVYMNGNLLRGQCVEMREEDGLVIGIGTRLQVDNWTEEGGIQWRAGAPGSYMQFAPKEVWMPIKSMGQRDERLRLLGYAGTAASLQAGTRGVEGCMAGTMDQKMPDSEDALDVGLLQALITQWREPTLPKVRSVKVVPDSINREGTGVGVELVHYVAMSMKTKGFQKKEGKKGHDMPVVVREPAHLPAHEDALRLWKERVAEEDDFPRVLISEDEEMFTSLGNGHFFQALNLFAGERPIINQSGGHYTIGGDWDLLHAVNDGVPSIVLSSETPRPVRVKISQLLNTKREFKWIVGEDGSLETAAVEEDTEYCPQFEAMSKFLDATVVNSLVRSHLGVTESKRQQG